MDNKAQSTRRRTCTCGVGEAQCAHETSVCTTTNPGGNPGFVVFVPTTKASLLDHGFVSICAAPSMRARTGLSGDGGGEVFVRAASTSSSEPASPSLRPSRTAISCDWPRRQRFLPESTWYTSADE